jgi:hypothetical protein
MRAWLDVIEATRRCESVIVVVSFQADADLLQGWLDRYETQRAVSATIEVIVEPQRWRGTAGLLRDVCDHYGKPARVLTVEAGSLPPGTLDPLFDPVLRDESACVGISSDYEPAGIYMFPRDAVRSVPKIGFHDIKEQLLPRLSELKRGAWPVVLSERLVHLRDPAAYLSLVLSADSLRADGEICGGRKGDQARSREGADGTCLIAPSVIIERGALVSDSVLLEDVVVRSGAIVSRSIIGPGTEVESRARIIDECARRSADPASGQRRRSLRPAGRW